MIYGTGQLTNRKDGRKRGKDMQQRALPEAWPLWQGLSLCGMQLNPMSYQGAPALISDSQLLPSSQKTPGDSTYPNIKMAYEYTCCLTGVGLVFPDTTWGSENTPSWWQGYFLQDHVVINQWHEVMPPTKSSAEPL